MIHMKEVNSLFDVHNLETSGTEDGDSRVQEENVMGFIWYKEISVNPEPVQLRGSEFEVRFQVRLRGLS